MWLRYSVKKDAVFCACCLLFSKGEKERTFIRAPVNDWKNFSKLVKSHASSLNHQGCYILAENFEQVSTGKTPSINQQLSSSAKSTVERNRHVLYEIIETLLLLGKQNIAIRGHTEDKSNFMACLQSKARHDTILENHLENAQAHAKYTSPEIQNELLTICANQLVSRIISECRQSGFYAIMADEATDCSTKEQLSMCLRFVSKEGEQHVIREQFVGFITCKSIKGVDLASHIIEYLQGVGLDILQIRGQCYDGAGNMAGKYNGVQALIRERTPLANYTHCKSHCLNLSLVHSSKLQCVRTMMSTVQDIAFAFDYSAKRLAAFTDELSQDAVTKEAMTGRHKLKTLCETRWMSRADSLCTFKSAFPVVVHALESLQENGDMKAGDHINSILQFPFIVSLVVAEHILNHLVGLTAVLQQVGKSLKPFIMSYMKRPFLPPFIASDL